jgi:hypothetical protein
MDNIKNRDAY